MAIPVRVTLVAHLHKTKTLMADGCSMVCYPMVQFNATLMTKLLSMRMPMCPITIKRLYAKFELIRKSLMGGILSL